MKSKMVVLAAAMVLAIVTGPAKALDSAEIDKRIHMMNQKLELSAEQQDSLRTVFENPSNEQGAMRDQFREILTDEQFEKFKQMRQKMMQRQGMGQQ